MRGRLLIACLIGIAGVLALLARAIDVALPSIADDLGVPYTDVQWVIAANLLGVGCLTVLAGKIADLRISAAFQLGAVLACVGIAFSAATQQLWMIILGQGLTGIGEALLIAVVYAATVRTTPPDRLGVVVGIRTAVGAAGGLLGYFVGGALVQGFGWRALFFVTLPFLVALLALAGVLLRRLDRGSESLRLPLRRAGLLGLGLLGVTLAFQRNDAWGWIPACLLLAVGGVVVVALFMVFDRRHEEPLVPDEMVTDRQFIAGLLVRALAYVVLVGWAFLLMAYLQNVEVRSPSQVGLLLLPFGAATAIAPLLAGRLVDRWGERDVVLIGVVLMAAGLVLMTRISSHSSYGWPLLPALLLIGSGVGTVLPAAMAGALKTAGRRHGGLASGIVSAACSLATALGLSVTVFVFVRFALPAFDRIMAVEHVAVAHEVRDRLVDILGSKGVGPQQSRLDLASATTLDWALRRTFATAYASTMGTMLAVVAVCGALALLLPTRHRVRTALAQRAGALVHSRTTVVASVAAVGLVVLVLFLVAGGSTPPVVGATIPGDEATIYSSLPLASTSARDVLGAERLALHEASSRAGRLRIRLIARSDADPHSGRWSRDATARNATAAVHDPHTVAYLGEYDSGASAVAVPVLNRAGILTVSPASTAVGLTRSDPGDPGSPGKYAPTGRRTFARVVQNDDAQGQALLTLLRQQGVRRVFVIHGAGRYGSGLARALQGYKSREGVSIVRDRVDAPVPRLVAGVRASDAQAVVFASADTHHAAELFKALHAAEPQVKLFAPDGLVGRRFARGLGAAAASVFLTAPGLEPNRYPPAGRAFFAAFERRYHRRPDPHAIYGYEAMLATLQAIARSRPTRGGRVSQAAVVNAFFRIKDRPSPIGVYSVDGAGDTTLPYYGGYVVQRGRLVDGP